MTDEKLPRDVPYDPEVPAPFKEDYIRSTFAAELVGVDRGTITRHLRNGTLAGIKITERTWFVKRITDANSNVPAIDMWTIGTAGNPNWKKSNA